MRRPITTVVGEADARGDRWLGLFDKIETVTLLKGMSGCGGHTLFGESQSSGTWHPIRVVTNARNN